MDASRDDEAAAPVAPLLSSPAAAGRRSHAADARILSAAFLFVFSAYSAAQNLESTVNTEGDLGTVSLGILYTSFTVFAAVASPVVARMGAKRSLVVGTSGYVFFILANLVPTWYAMVPASVYLGFAASIIWVGQGTYLTSAALSHARDNNLPEGPTLGNFTGEFWAVIASTQVIGNLLSFALLRNGKDGGSVAGKKSVVCCVPWLHDRGHSINVFTVQKRMRKVTRLQCIHHLKPCRSILLPLSRTEGCFLLSLLWRIQVYNMHLYGLCSQRV